jgi:polyketide synthase PksN
VAIIGMAGQFPDAADVETFWHQLITGHDAVHPYSPPGSGSTPTSQWAGILEERDCFDPLFFNIAPREALSMSLHQRLVLLESWKALEDAGYNPKDLAEAQAGIFIGAEPTGYFYETFTGASDALIASRLSYLLNLSGPALVVNTACSAAAAAIHLACESLRHGE